MRKIKNKQGFLLGDKVAGVIIAVLCIAVLIVLGGKLYTLLLDKKTDFKKAEATLDSLKSKIEYLQGKNIDDTADFKYVNPTGWYLVSYPIDEALIKDFEKWIPDVKPNSCITNCICLCPVKTEETKLTSFIHSGALSYPNMDTETIKKFNLWLSNLEIEEQIYFYYFMVDALPLCNNEGICREIDKPLDIRENGISKKYMSFYESDGNINQNLKIIKKIDRYVLEEY